MTQKEIDAAKRTLPSRFEYKNWTDEQKKLDNELSCRETVNSCLCYGSIKDFWEECPWRWGDKSYAAPHVRALGVKRVKEIVKEQEQDFAKAIVRNNVFTDSEGLTYNSIQWADEQAV